MALTILPGTIMAYAGSAGSLLQLEPNGWLLCDGKQFSNTEQKYQALFSAIGTSHGGDGANMFSVPDLRGLFLRGMSDASGNDPDAANRVSPRPDLHNSGNSGNAVGSKQYDEFKAHNHPVNPHAFMDNDMGTNSCEGDGGVNYGRGYINVSTVGGSETRPKNINVYYIIKL